MTENKDEKSIVKHVEVVGLQLSSELAEKLKDKYQDRQLDKLTTSVTAREAHVKKINQLKKRFEELSAGVDGAENIEALNPKIRELLASRIMSKHEDELLDILEQIAKEQKAIKKIDDSFDGITELL